LFPWRVEIPNESWLSSSIELDDGIERCSCLEEILNDFSDVSLIVSDVWESDKILSMSSASWL